MGIQRPATSREERRKVRAERIREAWAEHYNDLANGQITLAELLDHPDEKLMKVADVAVSLLRAGRYEKAGKILRGLPLLDPYVPYFHFLLGLLHEKQKDLDGAFAEYDEAIELCESMEPPGELLPAVLLAKVKLLARTGELLAALELSRRLLSGQVALNDAALEREARAILEYLAATCEAGNEGD